MPRKPVYPYQIKESISIHQRIIIDNLTVKLTVTHAHLHCNCDSSFFPEKKTINCSIAWQNSFCSHSMWCQASPVGGYVTGHLCLMARVPTTAVQRK